MLTLTALQALDSGIPRAKRIEEGLQEKQQIIWLVHSTVRQLQYDQKYWNGI